MKKFKKVLAIFLCVLTVFSICSVAASALDVSVNAGMDALRAQFSRDKGPKKDGYAIDYSYYSPVRSIDDQTKYPLVVFLPGNGEGGSEWEELKENEFCTWFAIEYQNRFANSNGAYLLFARSREDVALSWNSASLISPLIAAIRDFVSKNVSVDKDRIYIVGWSYGGIGALRAAADAPDLFAGVVSMCAPFALSNDNAKKLKTMAVWLLASKNDTIALYDTQTNTTWKRIRDNSNNKANIRFTTYDDAPNTSGIVNHKGWLEVINDFDFDKSGYSGRKTVDGNGNSVSLEGGMISWLSQQIHKAETPSQPTDGNKCSCDCHSSNGFTKFMWSIKVFFWKLFGMNNKKACACGVSHW